MPGEDGELTVEVHNCAVSYGDRCGARVHGRREGGCAGHDAAAAGLGRGEVAVEGVGGDAEAPSGQRDIVAHGDGDVGVRRAGRPGEAHRDDAAGVAVGIGILTGIAGCVQGDARVGVDDRALRHGSRYASGVDGAADGGVDTHQAARRARGVGAGGVGVKVPSARAQGKAAGLDTA